MSELRNAVAADTAGGGREGIEGYGPVGGAALVVISAGLLAYAVWKLMQAIRGRRPEGGGAVKLWERVSDAAGGLAYLVFLAIAVEVLTGTSGNSSGETRRAAAGVLGWPGGGVIVGTAGALLIAVSANQLWDAVSGGFADEIETERMSAAERAVLMVIGRVGLAARAIVFALVGYFLVRTAIDYQPRSAVGVDGALGRLRGEPLGPVLLGLVAAGLLTFAAFSLLEARYRRL